MSTTAVATSTHTKFIISGAALLKYTRLAALLVKYNPVVPVLENVLLQVSQANKFSSLAMLRVISSDLENYFTSAALPIEGRGGIDGAGLCIPAKQLNDLLRELPDQPLTLDMLEQPNEMPALFVNASLNLSLLPGGCGRARYELSGESAADFIRPTKMGTVTTTLSVPGHLLLAGLAATLPYVTTDELRPAMTGVLLDAGESRFTMVATDGHRLVRFTKEDQHTLEGIARRCIIPGRAATLLTKLVDRREQVLLLISENQMLVEMEKGTLQIRLTDEKYPDYENIIPVDQPNVLTVHRTELLAAVKRVGLFTNKTNHQVAFRLSEDSCDLEGEDLDFGNKATESVPGTYQGEGMRMGFNSRFLQSFLSTMPCQSVEISMTTPSRAAVLQSADADDGLLCLLMPVMINSYN